MNALYDTIGLNYANLRKSDERIANVIEKALGIRSQPCSPQCHLMRWV